MLPGRFPTMNCCVTSEKAFAGLHRTDFTFRRCETGTNLFLVFTVVATVMARRNRQIDCQIREDASCILPAGTPAWITPELIEATIRTWQPYYKATLSTEDAIDIIRNAGLLFEAISTTHSS